MLLICTLGGPTYFSDTRVSEMKDIQLFSSECHSDFRNKEYITTLNDILRGLVIGLYLTMKQQRFGAKQSMICTSVKYFQKTCLLHIITNTLD